MPQNILQNMTINNPSAALREEIDYRGTEDWMLQSDDSAEIHDVEGKENIIAFDEGARESISTICWTCSTNRGNRLFYNGSPFRASCLVYEVDNISWQAGGGWPVYRSYCPQPNYSASMRFRDAKRHQIVPVFGGVYWIGCHATASGCGRRTTDVFFWVNDDKYDDNTGTFRVCVTGWS